jgi:hypothetical protein
MSPKPHLSQPALRWLIRAIDLLLRQLMGIVELDGGEDSLIRVEFGRAIRDVRLADGTGRTSGPAMRCSSSISGTNTYCPFHHGNRIFAGQR